jgi:dihydroneopterin triphosphate diphosphatase
MARMPFQVAVLPFRKIMDNQWHYSIFRRSQEGYWQSIAGGGEDNETPVAAAKREAFEEAGIPFGSLYLALKTMTFVPTYHFKAKHHWDQNLFVIPVYYFAVATIDLEIRLSGEHSEYLWADYPTALQLLHWDSDKTALWELDQFLLFSARKNPVM